jgi:hypothetical protein
MIEASAAPIALLPGAGVKSFCAAFLNFGSLPATEPLSPVASAPVMIQLF